MRPAGIGHPYAPPVFYLIVNHYRFLIARAVILPSAMPRIFGLEGTHEEPNDVTRRDGSCARA